MTAPAKKRRRAPAPVVSPPWYSNIKHPGTILAIVSLLALVGGWWSSAGNWKPADDREFRNFKDEISRNLGTTKNEVILHSDKNTAKVETKLDTFAIGLTKNLRANQIEVLDQQERDMIWNQRRVLVANLAGIDRQLADPKKRNDTILMERKIEVENQLKALDGRIAETHERIRKLKEQQ